MGEKVIINIIYLIFFLFYFLIISKLSTKRKTMEEKTSYTGEDEMLSQKIKKKKKDKMDVSKNEEPYILYDNILSKVCEEDKTVKKKPTREIISRDKLKEGIILSVILERPKCYKFFPNWLKRN